MDLLAKSDEEIFAIGKPYWENLVRSSNLKDYGGFTRDFSTQMLFGANEVELGKQWANNELITNLNETYEPFGTLRRGEHITILIKQRNNKIPVLIKVVFLLVILLRIFIIERRIYIPQYT